MATATKERTVTQEAVAPAPDPVPSRRPARSNGRLLSLALVAGGLAALALASPSEPQGRARARARAQVPTDALLSEAHWAASETLVDDELDAFRAKIDRCRTDADVLEIAVEFDLDLPGELDKQEPAMEVVRGSALNPDITPEDRRAIAAVVRRENAAEPRVIGVTQGKSPTEPTISGYVVQYEDPNGTRGEYFIPANHKPEPTDPLDPGLIALLDEAYEAAIHTLDPEELEVFNAQLARCTTDIQVLELAVEFDLDLLGEPDEQETEPIQGQTIDCVLYDEPPEVSQNLQHVISQLEESEPTMAFTSALAGLSTEDDDQAEFTLEDVACTIAQSALDPALYLSFRELLYYCQEDQEVYQLAACFGFYKSLYDVLPHEPFRAKLQDVDFIAELQRRIQGKPAHIIRTPAHSARTYQEQLAALPGFTEKQAETYARRLEAEWKRIEQAKAATVDIIGKPKWQ